MTKAVAMYPAKIEVDKSAEPRSISDILDIKITITNLIKLL